MTGDIPTWSRGDRFRKARERTGLSQRDFAERLGVGRTTIVNAESDRTTIMTITARAWADVTGVDLDWLMDGDGDHASKDGGGHEI